MKEYELTLVVKNAVLINLMKSRGIKTASELGRLCGISPGIIGDFLNLTSSPYKKNGEIKPSAEALSKALDIPVEFMFPFDELYIPLDKNKFTAQVDKDEMVRLSGSCPSLMLEEKENENSEPFNGMLEDSRLTSREKFALKLRHKDGKTYKEIGKMLGVYTEDYPDMVVNEVTSERVRAIISIAERKLRSDIHCGLDLVSIAGKYGNGYKPTY